MARDAINGCVRSDQWEAIFVSADSLQGHIPTNHAVALLAVRTKLPAMNVGVTVRAPSADVTEYQPGMALDAIHFDVHALKWISGLLVVIKLRDCADRFPTCLCVAIFAGDGEGAVRAAGLGIGRTTILPKRSSLDQRRKQNSQ
jgi:hypothetical protein